MTHLDVYVCTRSANKFISVKDSYFRKRMCCPSASSQKRNISSLRTRIDVSDKSSKSEIRQLRTSFDILLQPQEKMCLYTVHFSQYTSFHMWRILHFVKFTLYEKAYMPICRFLKLPHNIHKNPNGRIKKNKKIEIRGFTGTFFRLLCQLNTTDIPCSGNKIF